MSMLNRLALLCLLLCLLALALEAQPRRARRPREGSAGDAERRSERGQDVVVSEPHAISGAALEKHGRRQKSSKDYNKDSSILPRSQINFRNAPKCPALIGIYRTLDFLVRKCRYSFKNVLDVGANVGDYSRDLKTYFPSVNIFQIEGSESNRQFLTEKGMPFEIALVGDAERSVVFYERDHGPGNSIFKEFGWHNTSGIEKRKALTTIDAIIDRRKGEEGLAFIEHLDFIKLDVQGAEVLALKGASNALHTAEVVAIEASIMNYNSGGASFFELHKALDEAGYALYDIIDLFRIRGHAVQSDMVFVRKSSPLWSRECTGLPPPAGYGAVQ